MQFIILPLLAFLYLCSQSFKIQANLETTKQDKDFISLLPQGFVYVNEIDDTIINNLRYFSGDNFVGQKLPGYYANRAILTKQAAEALKKANQQFKRDGYRIVIYDSYRPQKTVDFFISWSANQSATSQKLNYYPYLDKSVLFDEGYIAKRSGHSRGSTLDMTIIRMNQSLKLIQYKLRQLENDKLIIFLDDNSVDFGSSFDLFYEASHPFSQIVSKQYLQKREYLIEIMHKQGFKVLDTEWWHFTLQNQPFPNTYFDFDIK